MNVLVTGGAGFIGSHLVDALLARGDSVTVVDNFVEGRVENLPRRHSRLRVHRASILGRIDCLFGGVDVCYHLAALPRPQYSVVEPSATHRVNVNGTLNVLLACRDNQVRRLVFASSASVYGTQPEYPTSEKDEPHPMTPYSLHKVIGEGYCKLFSDLYGLETVALRFFNVYGPRQNPSGEYASLIPKFIQIIAAGGQPTIYGTGEQARDFVHVLDVVRALLAAGDTPGVSGRVLNIGSGDYYSVLSVFGMICQALDCYPAALSGPAQVEPARTMADIWQAKRLLGWRPEIELEAGIRLMALAALSAESALGVGAANSRGLTERI